MNIILLKSKIKDLIQSIDINTFQVFTFEKYRETEDKFYYNIDNSEYKHIHTNVYKLEDLINKKFTKYNLTTQDKALLFTELNNYFKDCLDKIKPIKNSYTWNLLDELISYASIEIESHSLIKDNRTEIQILKDTLNADFNPNTAKFEEFINQYNGYFKIAQIEHSGITEKEFIKITYLPNIERLFLSSGELYPLHTNLGRMKEYLNNRLIELEKIPKTDTASKNKIETKAVTPIKLELNQTQIIYLFQTLIEQKIINESINPTIWNLVSQYFIDANGKEIKNIHQSKDKLKNNKTGRPKKKADEIEKLVKDTKNKT